MGFFPLKPKEFVLESCKTYYSPDDFKWLWLALNGSGVIHRLVILPFSRGGDLFSFLLYYVIRPELKYIAICLCNNDPDFIFLLNWLVVYSMPTAMSFVIGIVQCICSTCWMRTLKISYLTHWSWERAEGIYLIYQVVRCHKGDSKKYARTYYEALNHWIRSCLHKSIRDLLPMHFTVWKLMTLTKR